MQMRICNVVANNQFLGIIMGSMRKFILLLLLTSSQAFAVEDRIYSDPSGNARLTPTTLTQLEEIKEQIKDLRGGIEQLQFDYARLNEKLDKLSADTEFRFNELQEKKGDIFSDIEKALEGEKHEPKSDKKIKESYNHAHTLFRARNYSKANEEFTEFLKNYPESEFSASAYYWLGETYFLTNKFDKAAAEYLKGYQLDNHGSRAADNLLRLGKSLAKLEKKKEACTTFAKYKKEFPNSTLTLKKELEEDMEALHCSK